jgi:proteic killer suppression protein
VYCRYCVEPNHINDDRFHFDSHLPLQHDAPTVSLNRWLGGQIATCTYGVNLVNCVVIINFGNQTTEDIFNGLDTKAARRIPNVIWPVAGRKLDMLNAAHELRDLKIPPANRLEALKGKWSGYHSIRINDQYRVVFMWIGGNAENVTIIDYH